MVIVSKHDHVSDSENDDDLNLVDVKVRGITFFKGMNTSDNNLLVAEDIREKLSMLKILMGMPIRIALSANGRRIRLTVENSGPALPDDVVSHLFVSMVSSRKSTDMAIGHLGLGLYIVRLIAEFHGGTVRAENLRGNSGVRFTVTFPT